MRSFETLEQKRQFDDIASRADWSISETDNGMYEAINKGLANAKGDYVWFLNSGDEARNGVIEALLCVAESDEKPEMIWGQAIYRFPNGDEVLTRPRPADSVWFSGPACHQAILFARDAVCGQAYDETFRLAGDYELVARLLSGGATHKVFDQPFCLYQVKGASNKNALLAMKEEVQIRRNTLGMHAIPAWALGLLKLAYQKLSDLFPGIKKSYRRVF